MTEKHTPKLDRIIRLENLDAMPAADPLSRAFKNLSDNEVDRRATSDPDAGAIPPGFWKNATPVEAETKEQITLRLDPDVLRHFRDTGKGYQSRINAVLKSYVQTQKKAG